MNGAMEYKEFIKNVADSLNLEVVYDESTSMETSGILGDEIVEIDFDRNGSEYFANIMVDDKLYIINNEMEDGFVLSYNYDDYKEGPVFEKETTLENCLNRLKEIYNGI